MNNTDLPAMIWRAATAILLFTLLFFRPLVLIRAAEPTPAPQSTTPPKGVGANTAVYLGQITNQDIDLVYQMNGYQPGGTITALVGPNDVNNSNFQNLANYAAERGIMFQLITYGQPAVSGTTNLINQALGAINQNPKALIRNISLTIENEINDPVQTQFHGSINDYYNYAYSLLSSVYSSPNGSVIIGMLSNLNITHPGGVSGGIAARDWYQQLAAIDQSRPQGSPSIFQLMRALASNAYPISPAYNPNGNISGVLAFLSDQLILQELGIDISGLPVYILETGLQPGWVSQFGNNQEEFLRMFAEIWKNNGRVVSINFFNALGKNPDWEFFSLLDSQGNLSPAIAALLSLIKEGVVTVQLANFIPIDLSKLVKCLDDKNNLIGYSLTQDDCKKLQLSGSGQTYGACKAQQNFPGAVETKGNSFTVEVTPCGKNINEVIVELRNAFLRMTKLNLGNNEKIASNINLTLDKITPPGYKPKVFKKTTLGKINFEICQENTSNWYRVVAVDENQSEDAGKQLEFETPLWMQQLATAGQETANMLFPGGSGTVKGESTISYESQLLAQGTSQDQCPQYVAAQIENVRTEGERINYTLRIFRTPAGEQAYPGTIGDVEIYGPNGGFHKENLWEGQDLNLDTTYSGAEQFMPSVSSVEELNQLSWKVTELPRKSPDCPKEITIAGGGKPMPRPTPPPRVCKRYNPSGGEITPKLVCVAGRCKIKGVTATNPAIAFLEGFINITQDIINEAKKRLCADSITLVVTPLISTPYAQQADQSLRNQALSVFKLPDNQGADESFRFKHALEPIETEFKSSPVKLFPGKGEIYGQKGVKDSYDWVQQALTPK